MATLTATRQPLTLPPKRGRRAGKCCRNHPSCPLGQAQQGARRVWAGLCLHPQLSDEMLESQGGEEEQQGPTHPYKRQGERGRGGEEGRALYYERRLFQRLSGRACSPLGNKPGMAQEGEGDLTSCDPFRGLKSSREVKNNSQAMPCQGHKWLQPLSQTCFVMPLNKYWGFCVCVQHTTFHCQLLNLESHINCWRTHPTSS